MAPFILRLLLLTVLRHVQECHSFVYYIKANESDECNVPCHTLSKFASNLSNDTSITLNVLSGVHSLNTNLSISNLANLSIHSDNATIVCESDSHFIFQSIELLFVRNMTFIGCGNNLVSDVREFLLQESTFKGQSGSGTVLTLLNTTADIVDCTFVDNQYGTVLEAIESLKVLITNIVWLIVKNVTGILRVGGVIISTHSNVTINLCNFENNTAEVGGDIFANGSSKISVFESNFTGDGPQPSSVESPFGGAIYSDQSDISCFRCHFAEKHVTCGPAIASTSSRIAMNGTRFTLNSGSDHGGAVFTYRSDVFIYGSIFDQNIANGGAGLSTIEGRVTLEATTFIPNVARSHGGALEFYNGTSTVIACLFENNTAKSFGGAMLFWISSGKIYGKRSFIGEGIACNNRVSHVDSNCLEIIKVHNHSEFTFGDKTSFISNSAPAGAALQAIKSTVRGCGALLFSKNTATVNSNVYFLNSEGHFEGSLTITQNEGSFFAFNSNISFSGCSLFKACFTPKNTTAAFKEGGALTVYQTTLNFQGEHRFENNHAEIGGAILGTESEIYVSKKANVAVVSNNAKKSGGGLYLSQSELFHLQESSLMIYNNTACAKGGGIHAASSSMKLTVTGSKDTDERGDIIEVYRGAMLNIAGNTAQYGGGVFLEGYSKLILLKDYIFDSITNHSAVHFIENFAHNGGAVYVDDASNTDSCLSNPFEVSAPKLECFVSVVATETYVTANINFSLTNILFHLNVAKISGSTLFGGLLDRCIVSPFNEVDRTYRIDTEELLTYKGNGLDYIFDISAGQTYQSVSSHPVQICPCVNNCVKCGYRVRTDTEVRKGHNFNVSLIAVDQVHKPLNATITGYLHSTESNLINGQVTQVPDVCTDVTFRVISPHNSEELTLFASDGPCKDDAELSTLKVSITFLPCTCPIGFQVDQSEEFSTYCSCVCHPKISPYVKECNSITQSFQRDVNVWISFVNGTDYNGYLVHKYCPFDYCVPPNMSAPINLNLPDGVDAQCALNHTGMLCGACEPGLSLSLGSSKCLKCPDYWPALFVSITVFAILAGVALVVLFFWLNITVAVGTLNGLLFYANIVAANRVVLLPYPEPNVITVFISWLNLDLGIDICYIKGMDIYIKTWLQLAFPTYIIFLVALLIIISRYSSRISETIAKRNPVATLATLILISYGKLFHVVLLAQPFTYAALSYPNGDTKYLWLPDGTVPYLAGRHTVLFVAALLILLICVAYSFLLLCWQLILYLPNWKIFKCIKNPTFYLFMEAYHVPYTPKHRYWTGMLLLARAIIYLVAAANVSGDPQVQLVSIVFILSCIILLKMVIATKIFKKWLIDSLESFFYFNIIFLASFTSYNLSTGNNQDGIAYTSVVLSITVTLFIILFHAWKYTALFPRARTRSFIANFKTKMKPRAESVQIQVTNAATDDSHRYDDIMDLTDDTATVTVVSANNVDCYDSYEASTASYKKPGSTVVEMN